MESSVKLRQNNTYVKVSLSEYNSLIEDNIIMKWQDILDLCKQLFDVPAALIMRLGPKDIEVFLKSSNKDNPYVSNESCELGLGLYCETVIATKDRLHVANALDDDGWKDNPDVEKDMIHYLGRPLIWPNGDIFGTICILDNKTKHYDPAQFKLFDALKDTVEKDLDLISKHFELSQTYEDIKKTHHLIVEHEKNHLTNQLVSNITHEISSPIGVALTTASFLDHTVKKSKVISLDKLREGASMVQKNLEQASLMLKSFKELSHHKDMQDEVDIKYYINSIVQSMKYDLKKYHVDVTLEIKDNIRVWIDTGYLSQILINLVINSAYHAFKTIESRSIIIKADVKEDILSLSIEDNGIGISEENLANIFDAFVRFDSETEGSGLGLTIVKDIVTDKLSGSITCLSKLGQGTIFTIELPLEVHDEKH